METLEIDLKEVEKLNLSIEKHCMNHLKNFLVVSCPSTKVLYQFLYRMPYLEKLTLYGQDSKLEEVIPIQENIGSDIHENFDVSTFLQIKYLSLKNMRALENIGFERDPVLQYCLEHLHIEGCGKLIKLAPSSVTLTHLTTLEVNRCLGMNTLMGFSIARSMVQLVSLKITTCRKLENIVAWQDNEVKVTYQQEIAFSKLKALELVKLPSLSCFISFENNGTSLFEFPSLEKLVVTDCPEMTKFCNGTCTAPNLQVISINNRKENWSWKRDLNGRIWSMYLSSVSTNIFLSYFYVTLKHQYTSSNILTRPITMCIFLKIYVTGVIINKVPKYKTFVGTKDNGISNWHVYL